MASIVVSIEPTDGQAPLGARTSQDKVDTKQLCPYKYQTSTPRGN